MSEQVVDERDDNLKKESGNVVYADALVTFLYLLMREDVTFGKIENALRVAIASDTVVEFSNGYMANYANNVATALRDAKTAALTKSLEQAFSDKVGIVDEEPSVKELVEINKEDAVGHEDTVYEEDDCGCEEVDPSVTVDKLKVALSNLENLKHIIPSGNVPKIAEILQNEIDRELSPEVKGKLEGEKEDA